MGCFSVMSITTREWNRISSGYKTETGCQKSILYYDDRFGTCLMPVRLDDETGLEFGAYTFEESGLRFRVYAYSMAEALRIIRRSDHLFSKVQNLLRKEPYPHPEQVKLILGRLVYLHGRQYQISGPDGRGVEFAGECSLQSTPDEVYTWHFEPIHADKTVFENVTLFFSYAGKGRVLQADTARLQAADLGSYQKGCRLSCFLDEKEQDLCWDQVPTIWVAPGKPSLPSWMQGDILCPTGERGFWEMIRTYLEEQGLPHQEMDTRERVKK